MIKDQSEATRLAEYNALRQEQVSRSGHQQTLMNINLTAVAAITALAARPEGEFRPVLLLIIPFVSSALAVLWTDHHVMIDKGGRYMRELWIWAPSWEEYHRRSDRRLKDVLFKLAIFVAFLVPAYGTLGLTASSGPDVRGLPDDLGPVAFWVGALLTLLATVYLALAFLRMQWLVNAR